MCVVPLESGVCFSLASSRVHYSSSPRAENRGTEGARSRGVIMSVVGARALASGLAPHLAPARSRGSVSRLASRLERWVPSAGVVVRTRLASVAPSAYARRPARTVRRRREDDQVPFTRSLTSSLVLFCWLYRRVVVSPLNRHKSASPSASSAKRRSARSTEEATGGGSRAPRARGRRGARYPSR